MPFCPTNRVHLKTYSFKTTAAEEKEIVKRAAENGGSMGGFCATAVRDVLSGVGPFKKLKKGWPLSWPSTLGSDLEITDGVSIGKGDSN